MPAKRADQKRALLLQQPTEQVVAHVTRIADQEHALETAWGASPTDRSGSDVPPSWMSPSARPEDPSGQLTKAITHSVGADLSLLDFPSSVPTPRCADIPSASRHTPTATNLPCHAVGQEVEDVRPHGIAEGPPDGHATHTRLAKAAKRLARSLSLGTMNLDVEGADSTKRSASVSPAHQVMMLQS